MEECVKSVVYSSAVQNYPEHTHNHYQMIYVKRGESTLRIASESYPVKAPCLVFINHLEPHAFDIRSGAYERYSVNIAHREANHQIKDQSLLSVFCVRSPRLCPVVDISPFAKKIDTLVGLLHEEFHGGCPASGEACVLLLNVLLIELRRRRPDAFPAADSGIAGTVWEIKRDLEQHADQEFTLTGIAARRCVSPHYLAHSFKRITGYSVKQYHLLCRLSAARELLGSTQDSVTEISRKAGFSDMSNFSRYFRRYMGVTPTAYRKQVREHGAAGAD